MSSAWPFACARGSSLAQRLQGSCQTTWPDGSSSSGGEGALAGPWTQSRQRSSVVVWYRGSPCVHHDRLWHAHFESVLILNNPAQPLA